MVLRIKGGYFEHRIKPLVFLMERECVFCEVQTKFVNYCSDELKPSKG
jgi:hypothetical protein